MTFRINLFIYSRMIITIFIFLSVETSLDKEKNKSHTHIFNLTSNQQINIQNINQKKKNLNFVSLRLSQCLSASTTLSEFATTISESASMKFLVNRRERSQNACVRFFTFSQSTSMEMNLLHTAIREQITWREELGTSSQLACYPVK